VDGSPLTDLAGYEIYYGAQSRNYTDNVPVTDPLALCYTFNPAPGDYFIAMTALDVDANESAYSNEVLKTQADTNPLPPGGVAIVGDPAYIIVQSENTLVLLDIGIVTALTTCDPDVGMRDDNGVTAYKVPVSSVTPYSPAQEMIIVFSPCGN